MIDEKELKRRERISLAKRRHGHALRGKRWTPTYSTWMAMRRRCYDTKNKCFNLYGGRGIQSCARWFDFENFLTDMGEKPSGKSLDRINGDGHYMPSNCRWATPSQQATNRHYRLGASGVRGVSLRGGKYRARITLGGRRIQLGTFSTISEATEAYRNKLESG
jgi:hypothetical protein